MSQDPQKNPMEQLVLALYYHAAQMIKEGKSREEIIKDLMAKGVNQATAETIIAKLDVSRANVARRNGYRNLLIGLLLLIACLLPLFGLFFPQVEGWQFWGVILILGLGIFIFGRGFMQVTGL